MDKAELDPVAAANAAVTVVQQTLEELIAQRGAVTGREERLTAERAKIAFAAHGAGNSKAKTRLAAIHRELAEIGSEIGGFDAAIEEAEARLAAAKSRVGQEIERRRCQEALDHLETLLQHAHGADAALRQYVAAITAVDKLAERICAVARHPGRTLVIGAIRRSLSSELTAVHALTEIPLCDPVHRHPLSYWASAWSASLRGNLQARIDGVPDTQIEEDEAA
jgi:chromosome segregation ATPase